MSDIGNQHVIDWYLWRELRLCSVVRAITGCYDRFDPEDWTRYDGELL